MSRNYSSGFALPSLLIASIVMLAVLVVAVTGVSSTRNGLNTQYFSQLAREAAESGLVKAEMCLRQNNYEPSWTASRPLRPNTDCAGVIVSGAPEYVLQTTNSRTSFTVPYPDTSSNGAQQVVANGQLERTRTSNQNVWRTYSAQTFAVVGAQVTFNRVTFGYTGENGAFFGTIGPGGDVTALGYNANGQLGNGTTTSVLTPEPYQLPQGAYAQSLFSSFLSVGDSMFAITTDGRVYGSGNNAFGQLGAASSATLHNIPVQFRLPAGVQGRHVGILRNVTYVIGSDNNIYAAGQCMGGQLGSNYTISGCADRNTYVRVALPTPNTSDPNTLPVIESDWVQSTNLAVDRYNAFVRMQGGRVYGWGTNEYGQLGNGTNTPSSVPLKIGTWGDSGQPRATQVAFDGETLFVLDSNGDVYASGSNKNGQLGGAMAPMKSSTGFCFDNPGNSSSSGTRVRIHTCNNSTAQKLEWTHDGAIKFRPTGSVELCLDNASNSSANGNPIRTYTCNDSAAQKWEYRDNGSIYNPSTGKCVDNPGNSTSSGTEIQLHDCNGTPAQSWSFENLLSPSRVPIPAASGKVTRMTTDQWSTLYLTEDGKVWGAGANDLGQLGTGATTTNNPALKEFILPAGRRAVDFYTTRAGAIGSVHANTYVVLDDGSVWGAGANTYGQLGTGATSSLERTPRRMNIPTGVRARSVQSGLGTTVVLSQEGKIYTVGNNGNGQLGDGTTNNSSTVRANQYTNIIPTTYY